MSERGDNPDNATFICCAAAVTGELALIALLKMYGKEKRLSSLFLPSFAFWLSTRADYLRSWPQIVLIEFSNGIKH